MGVSDGDGVGDSDGAGVAELDGEGVGVADGDGHADGEASLLGVLVGSDDAPGVVVSDTDADCVGDTDAAAGTVESPLARMADARISHIDRRLGILLLPHRATGSHSGRRERE